MVGGYLYRGPDPDMQGKYVFGDNPRSRVWAFDPADPEGTLESLSGLPGALGNNSFRLLSFSEDSVGNLYALDAAGSVLLLEPGSIAGDYNGDGLIGPTDYSRWAASYGSQSDLAADGNGDGVVDAADYVYWRDALEKFGAVYAEPTSGAVPEPAAAVAAALLLGMACTQPQRGGASRC